MALSPHPGRQAGFSLLELIVVVVVIGVVAAVGAKFFIDAMDRARAASVEMLAWRFAQSVSVLRAWSTLPDSIDPDLHGIDSRGVHWVSLDGVIIYLNENRWPANADARSSPTIGRQSAEGCTQLLNALLKQPVTYNDWSSGKRDNQYNISVRDGRVCRYQLAQNKEEFWFFDYSLETGKVSLSLPRLRMEQYADN